jgi:hypothetical protein
LNWEEIMATKPLPITAENQTYKFLSQFLEKLFEPEGRRLQQALDRIIDQNEELAPTGGKLGIWYGGERFVHSRAQAHFNTVPPLAWALNDQMDAWLKDKATIKQDRELIQQTLFKCVYGWNDRQDFRNRLPDCLIPLLGSNLARTVPFEEAVCLNPRDKRQFEKILPKIELYATTRLIY